MTQSRDELLDERLRALAHAARREIIAMCAHRPRSAGELANATGLTAPATSEHLKVLRKTGLVSCRAEGRFRIYSTDLKRVEQAARALTALGRGP